MKKRVLLLGAGFSRNWGGWLASEALEYLLGASDVDRSLRALLIANKSRGFEEALGILQAQANGRPSEQLSRMEAALLEMFKRMNEAFAASRFEFAPVATFLRRFDAIFTLNQDTLLERHYLKNVSVPAGDRRWQGACLPGMERIPDTGGAFDCKWRPGRIEQIPPDRQPYIKLHGSSNWQHPAGDRQLLIMGSNKSAMIDQVPILKWGFETFTSYLAQPKVRLMVIGYSFGDEHVNRILEDSANKEAFELFVVDPLGMDVMDRFRDSHIPGSSSLKDALWGVLRGCSRRSLTATFTNDEVERSKLERFLVE